MKFLLSAITIASFTIAPAAFAEETTPEGSHGDTYLGSEPHGGQCPYGVPTNRSLSEPTVSS